MKLKIELFRYGTLVFGKVLEQTGTKGTSDKSLDIYKDNDLSIVSCGSPQLTNNELFVRGSRVDMDNNVFVKNFETEEKAIEICNKIRLRINAINSNNDDDKLIVEKIM